jgi:hypothetical protein
MYSRKYCLIVNSRMSSQNDGKCQNMLRIIDFVSQIKVVRNHYAESMLINSHVAMNFKWTSCIT